MPIIRVAALGPTSRALLAASREITKQLATNAVLGCQLSISLNIAGFCRPARFCLGRAQGSGTHNL